MGNSLSSRQSVLHMRLRSLSLSVNKSVSISNVGDFSTVLWTGDVNFCSGETRVAYRHNALDNLWGRDTLITPGARRRALENHYYSRILYIKGLKPPFEGGTRTSDKLVKLPPPPALPPSLAYPCSVSRRFKVVHCAVNKKLLFLS